MESPRTRRKAAGFLNTDGNVMKKCLWSAVILTCVGGFGCCARADVICPRGDINADCFVDIEDLAAFGTHWLAGTLCPQAGLKAHWRFDESGGTAVLDGSGSGFTGQLNGCTRIPDGVFGPALQLDGLDDFVQAPCVLNPADGPLSAFAWVRGGRPREAILAQADGSGIGWEWLQAAPDTGNLLTRLTDGNSILTSNVSICGDNWRHVGVVWDGARRRLYVDGICVACDTEPLDGLLSSDGLMYIGRQRVYSPDLFWTGCIDDVRIYDRALDPVEVAALAAPPVVPDNADLDGRTGIDAADFAILAHNWMLDFSGEYRCIWVDSWNWNRSFMSRDEADELIATCRANNINTVIVEVRKVGDASYNSNIEPRIESYIKGGPSFDPLGYLLEIAHDTSGGKKYIQVHAWFVVHRILKTSTPYSPHHVLSLHPEYIMEDINGNTVSDGSYYLDPGHPGAVDWNVAVILDCLQNYDIDGVNLDYIRYPGPAWGYNPVSIARYNAFHGKSGQPSGQAWADWRRECITNEVKKIYVKSLMIKPHVVLTVDTINWGWGYDNYTSSSPYASVFQDWVGWLRQGIIDYNTFMGYVCQSCPCVDCPVPNPIRYQNWANLSLANDDKRGTILCTAAYMQLSVQDAIDQLLWSRAAGAAGLNIYDWYSEVKDNQYGQTRSDFYRELKDQVFPTWVDPPMHAWKVRPRTGIIEGTITAPDGAGVDHARVMINGKPETANFTDGSGWFAIMEVPPGTHAVRISVPGRTDLVVGVTIPNPGDIVTLNATFAD